MRRRRAANNKMGIRHVPSNLSEEVGTFRLSQHSQPRDILSALEVRLRRFRYAYDARNDICFWSPLRCKLRELSRMLNQDSVGSMKPIGIKRPPPRPAKERVTWIHIRVKRCGENRAYPQ